jgi:hypothetical protein
VTGEDGEGGRCTENFLGVCVEDAQRVAGKLHGDRTVAGRKPSDGRQRGVGSRELQNSIHTLYAARAEEGVINVFLPGGSTTLTFYKHSIRCSAPARQQLAPFPSSRDQPIELVRVKRDGCGSSLPGSPCSAWVRNMCPALSTLGAGRRDNDSRVGPISRTTLSVYNVMICELFDGCVQSTDLVSSHSARETHPLLFEGPPCVPCKPG